MGFFDRKPKIGRPTPVFHAAAPVRYPGTMIEIRPSVAVLPGGGNYTQTVYRHLAEIESVPVGAALFAELGRLGKTQTIIYGGPNSNQAAGGLGGYKRLRKYHDSMDRVQFAAELQFTIAASMHDKHWLAQKLYEQPLYTWLAAVPPTPIALAVTEIDSWLAGTTLPAIDQMDALMLVLEQWARSGNGCGTRINYDPHKDSAGGLPRPAQAALYHELMHAYYNAGGNQLGREDSTLESAGGRLFELMAVGLAPFDTRPLSENQFRAQWPGVCAPRAQYP